MSTALTVGILAAGLFVLIAIAVTLQSLEKRKKERRLLESALNTRARNFQHLLEGFPQGFLGRDLQVLVCRALADTYDQLVGLNAGNRGYRRQRDLNAERLRQFQQKGATQSSANLGNLAQIREVQKLLTNLHKFVASLLESKRISAQDAKKYSQQVRQLLLSTTLDGINLQVTEAIAEQKPRLAMHHIQSAIDKLSRENGAGQHQARIAGYRQQLAELEQQVNNEEAESMARREEADKEWDEINKPDDSWKKKALYD